jgi:hypothetical protein
MGMSTVANTQNKKTKTTSRKHLVSKPFPPPKKMDQNLIFFFSHISSAFTQRFEQKKYFLLFKFVEGY